MHFRLKREKICFLLFTFNHLFQNRVTYSILNKILQTFKILNVSLLTLCISQFQLRPCPPGLTPGHQHFFFSRMANTRGWGHLSRQMPRGVDEGRGQMPRPRDRTSPINTATVFIHCTVIPLSAFLCVIFHVCRPTSPSSIVCNGTIRC